MSRSLIGCVVAAFFFALPASLSAAEPEAVAGRPPLRILPVGDSITRGSYLATQNGRAMGLPHPEGGGWRKGLQDKLRASGIAFDFVGELDFLAYGRDGVVDPAFDPHHHGLAGFGNARILAGGTVPTPDDLLPDGVHPNRAGMDKIAATWFAAIAGK